MLGSILTALPQADRDVLLPLLRGHLAAGTLRQYEHALSAFWSFCAAAALAPLPASVVTVLRFLVHLQRADRVHGKSVKVYVAAIHKVHDLVGAASPTDEPLVRAAIAGFKRCTASASVKLVRRPLRVDDAYKLVLVGLRAAAAGDWRTMRACAVVIFQFIFFARARTAAAQLVQHVHCDDAGLRVTLSLEKGKDAASRTLEFPNREYPGLGGNPPFRLLQLWVQHQRRLAVTWLFGDPADRVPSRAIVDDSWRLALRKAGIAQEERAYLPHSARSGGASAALALGASTLVVAQRGGWLSTDSAVSYVYPVHRSLYDVWFFGFMVSGVSVWC